ncbi:MAG: hypothetical protein ACLFRP_01945 [Puniceicoccaceae bacterium]
MSNEPAAASAAGAAEDSLTRPFDLAARLKPPRFGVDAIAFADLGLIALLALLLSNRFLFSPGVAVDLPVFEDPDTVIGVRADAVATVWEGKIVTTLGSYPLDRIEVAFGSLAREGPSEERTLLLLIDRSTDLRTLGEIYESARRAGFPHVQMAARPAGPAAPPAP